MKPIPDISRRNLLRAFLASAAAAGTAAGLAAFAGPAHAAPPEQQPTPGTGQPPSAAGHRHLIGVL